MKASTVVTRGAALAGPLAVLAIPKCPLCLLPLLAAAGIALPSAPLLDALAIAFVIIVAFTLKPRALAIGAGAIIVIGRLASIPLLTWIGVALMLVITAARVLRHHRCERRSHA